MDYIRKVNGLSIYFRTYEEMNKILQDKDGWGIEYYIPGRVILGYVVNTFTYDKYTNKKIKHVNEFATETEAIAFCKTYKRPDKKNIEDSSELMYEMQAAFGPNKTIINVLTGQTYKT